jgi:hypothetical protein
VIDDLHRAVSVSEEATASIPIDYPERWAYLYGSAITLLDRFIAMGSVNDVDRAIQMNEQALAVMASDHFGRAICLNSLGSAFQHKFDRSGSLDDLDKAKSKFSIARSKSSADLVHSYRLDKALARL